MGLGKSLKSIVSKVVKSASGGTKKVVGKTLKTGAKAVKTAAKPLAKVPGMEGVSKSVSKAADQTSAEGNRGLDKATSATDRIVDAAGNIVSGVSDASVGMAKGGLGGNLDFLQAAARGDVRGMGAGALGTWNSAVGGLTDITKTGATGLGESVGVAGDVSGQDKLNRYGENISREGGNVADVAVPMGAELAANYFTGGAAGAALAAARAAQSGGVGGLMSKDAMLKAGASYAGVDPTLTNAALGARSGGLKGAAYGAAGFDPEQFKQGMSLLQGKGVDTQGLLKAAATYGAGAAGKAYGLDPSELKMLEAGTSVATGGNLKDAAMNVGGEYAGMTPQQMSIAKSVSSGNLQNAAGEYAGLSPDQIQAAKSVAGGDVQGAAMNLGGSYAGATPEQMQAAQAVAKGKIPDVGGMAKQYGGQQVQDTISMGASGIQKQLGNAMPNIKQNSEALQNIARQKLLQAKNSKAQMQAELDAQFAGKTPQQIQAIKQNQQVLADMRAKQGWTPEQIAQGNRSAQNAQDINNDYFANEADAAQARNAPQQPGMWDRFTGMFTTSPEEQQQKDLEEMRSAQGDYEDSQKPGFFSKLGSGISGALGKAADYNEQNPELANAAIGTTAAGVAFKQQQDALQNQQRILSEQLDQARKMQTFEQETPEMYKEMAAGGPTSKYAQEMMGTARDAGKIAQAGRGAALERMSRMGRGGGDLEAMLGGAQEGANRYAEAGQQAMMRDQDLRIGAQKEMSAIDQFNVNQRRAGQSERVAMEQGLRGQEQAYAGTEGQNRANLTSGIANTAMGTNQAIANRAMANKQAAEQQQAAQAEKLRQEAIASKNAKDAHARNIELKNMEIKKAQTTNAGNVIKAVATPQQNITRAPANITQQPVKKKVTAANGAW